MSQMSKRNSWKRKGENPEKEKADPELLLWGPSKRKNFICLNKDTKKKQKKQTCLENHYPIYFEANS